ncbi:MAG: hypothetical protein WCA10_23710 [Terracidiphilus sp.]
MEAKLNILLKKVSYESLNSRQQETYNFQKISGVLADFGYLTIRLSDDWNGADFIAQHFKSKEFLKVQLKGRLCFYKKYQGKDLYICFREASFWYLYPHDELLPKVHSSGSMSGTKSWDKLGGYSFPSIPRQLEGLVLPYRIPAKIDA